MNKYLQGREKLEVYGCQEAYSYYAKVNQKNQLKGNGSEQSRRLKAKVVLIMRLILLPELTVIFKNLCQKVSDLIASMISISIKLKS